MRIIILTQEEHLYLPGALAKVCLSFPQEIVCITSAPAMSTHGGFFKGLARHLILFGCHGSFILGFRVAIAKFNSRSKNPQKVGPFYSIKQVARVFNIPYIFVRKLSDPLFKATLAEYKPDLLVSISCPQIIGNRIRSLIPRGCINVHGAPLPKYRGLMPAFWVLRNGESKTATTVHHLASKLDDGDIILQKEVDIFPEDTWDSLVRKTKTVGAEALVEAIRLIKEGKDTRIPNDESQATYFSFPTVEDRRAFLKAGRRFF